MRIAAKLWFVLLVLWTTLIFGGWFLNSLSMKADEIGWTFKGAAIVVAAPWLLTFFVIIVLGFIAGPRRPG